MSNSLAKIIGMGGGGVDTWTSGATIKQYAYVISPTNLEVYQRKTATGSGATDPYNDSTNYRPASYSLWSSVTPSGATISNGGAANNEFTNVALHTLFALAANTRTSVLSLTGRGALRFIGFASSASIASLRVEIVIDGTTVFDNTYTSLGTSTRAIQIGSLVAITAAPTLIGGLDLCEFTNSAQVFYTSTTAQSSGNIRFCQAYVGYRS